MVSVNDTVNIMIVFSTTATLTGLGNYTVYNISVRAVTVGERPSISLSQRTAQNGMMLLKLYTTAPLVLHCILVTSFCSTFFVNDNNIHVHVLPLNCTATCT